MISPRERESSSRERKEKRSPASVRLQDEIHAIANGDSETRHHAIDWRGRRCHLERLAHCIQQAIESDPFQIDLALDLRGRRHAHEGAPVLLADLIELS